ncbi:hypothetical protein EV356DRAFT_535836 [Viridothelium virens]|uniref:Uncharacterized protein n=1 Tax=Viridothelium virens TaxID=1048519 RepID=A0A6A6GZ48_VIRVR|nr:hypothetical protein EV356DRAFT_535836 [Viridothelium virens]
MRSFVILLSFIAALAVGASKIEQRDALTIGRLYGYGTNIGGLPLFYGDGIAYLGKNAPSNVSLAMNVTFLHPSSSNMSVIADPLNSNTTILTPPSLFINAAPNAVEPAGFITLDNTTNSTTETDFTIFGSALYFKNSSGPIQAQFYASPTDTDGTYVLKWNTNNIVESNSVPVTLKNIAPPSILAR